MKKAILILLFLAIITSYGSGKTVVKLLLPANCKSSKTLVDELKKNNGSKLGLFPNPNQGSFTLNVSFESKIDEATIRIYNSMGQILYNEMICSDSEDFGEQIRLNGLTPGIYFVNVKNANQEVSRKMIIK